MQSESSPTSIVAGPTVPRQPQLAFQPVYVQRKVTARWKEWEPWVLIDLGRPAREHGPVSASAELARLRREHSQHLLRLLHLGISMRAIRRHRLDDPRITDELRTVLMRAAIERRRKAWLARHRTVSDAQGSTTRPGDAAPSDSPPRDISPVQDKRSTIESIRKRVSEHFCLRDLRDQDLQVRSNRRIITFPRQVAMHIARHLTTASLPEIGRQFGGMHHTTVLHSINKIAEMRRFDERLNCTIARLMDDCSSGFDGAIPRVG